MSAGMVLVVGAGPTGMTAAIELKRAGLEIRIIDKAMRMAQHSQALVVQARTLEQLQRYGIAADAVARGRKLIGAKFFSDGKQITSVATQGIQSRYPYVLFLPQTETEAILNTCMESLGVKAERGTELVALTGQNSETSATLRRPDGTEEELTPRWIIGCDGAHSRVREMAGIPFQGEGVGLTFFLGDLEIEGPDAPDKELAIHFNHGDVVFMGRLSDKLTRLIVALHAKQGDPERGEISIKDFQDAVDQAGVRVKVNGAAWMTPFRVNDRQAQRYRKGNVFLAGDASHIHSPVGGQGMNTGMQDIANLVWKMAAVARGADDVLLDTYHEERSEVGRALLRFTQRGLMMATTANPLIEGARNVLLPLLSRLKPVQRAAMGFISETAIEYRSSSIVIDRSGDGALRAGDRLPDLTLLRKPLGTTLLSAWTLPRHLAILVNGTEGERDELQSALPQAEVISIEDADLEDDGRRVLGTGRKLVIVRPDGYVGFRGAIEDRASWAEYARQDALA